MFRVGAFYESRAGTAALQNIAGLADNGQLHVAGDNITVPGDTTHLMALWAIAQTATSGAVNQFRLESPSLKPYLDIAYFEDTATAAPEPTAGFVGFNDLLNAGIFLDPGEALQAKSANSGTNTEDALLAFWLGDGNYVNPYAGVAGMAMKRLRFTQTTDSVANTWTNVGSLVFEQALPVGTYAVGGLIVNSTTGQLARLVFGNQGARPGCIAFDTIEDVRPSAFERFNLGVWGYFRDNSPPSLEVLTDSADSTTIEGWLDVIRISA